MMSASYWMLISGVLGALSNLCMRKSMDAKGSVFAFFFYQLLFTFIVVSFLYPIRADSYSINLYTVFMGVLCGLALGSLKYIIGFALKKGPASLTFASVNSASVVPPCIIALFSGSAINFTCTSWQLVGSLLVVIGLFWAVSNQGFSRHKARWILFALLGFAVHTIYLLLAQLHVLILENSDWLHSILHHGSDTLQSEWYVPLIFATACLMHMIIYSITEKRLPSLSETLWGILGGICNGVCSFFFMQGTLVACGVERSFIFPIFSISLIVFCNLWGQVLYKERVHWRANGLCCLGVLAGAGL